MQVVVLAAGAGTRLRPLTNNRPKPLVPVAGKSIVEHTLAALPGAITEIIFVIGYRGDQIQDKFGAEFAGRPLRFIRQKKLFGTGHALRACRKILGERFLVLMGDNIYCRRDMEKCLAYEQAMLVDEVKGRFAGGRIKLDKQGNLSAILEGIHHQNLSLVNTGLYVLNRGYFDLDLVRLPGPKKEYGLPQAIAQGAAGNPVKIVKASRWIQITSPGDVKRAEKLLGKSACGA